MRLAEDLMPIDAGELFIAAGRNFPDALAGAVLAVKRGELSNVHSFSESWI